MISTERLIALHGKIKDMFNKGYKRQISYVWKYREIDYFMELLIEESKKNDINQMVK